MNPFLMGLLSLTGAQNPDLFGSGMAGMGISPEQIFGAPIGAQPGAGGAFPDSSMPTGGMPMQPGTGFGMENLGALLSPTGAGGMMGLGGPPQPPAAAGGAGAGGLPTGAKMPVAPNPVFSGGISGAEGAPRVTGQTGGANSMEALLALISGKGKQDPLRVPQLGALLQRGVY